ncbi:ethylbenzene dehydrogenase [bacterium BMS3Bbin02]|nr:ethylbenzene dehydrogenase [bacterium BMS3Bbin02]
MGADDEDGDVSTGMVDIWHWETECAAGIDSGGLVNPSGDGKDPGNDATCNFDDEWATDAETREDDNGAGAENSLFGVWSHSNPTADAPGVWYFEMSRPLQTGDAQDVQFTAGESTLLALAYWDVDLGPDGWHDDSHVQSSNQEWIVVNLK